MAGKESITLALRPSRRLRQIIWAVQLLAGVIILIYPASFYGKLFALFLLALNILLALRFLVMQDGINKIYLSKSHCFIWSKGEKIEVQICGLPFSSYLLTILILRVPATFNGAKKIKSVKTMPLVIVPDSTSHEERRRLRVMLTVGEIVSTSKNKFGF